MDFEASTIYVDIDALFDTRAATLNKFGIERAKVAIASNYYDRIYDEFEGIETDTYFKAYQSRDVLTLKDAMVTPVARMIYLFAKQTLEALVSSPYRRQPKVFLNTYPYRLEEETVRYIVAGLRAITKNIIDVEVGYLTLEEMTPRYVKQHYAVMVMYAYWDWLEVHAQNQNLTQTQCPQVTLIGPRLVKSKEAAQKLSGQDVFTAIETYTSLFIKLQLYPVNIFCVDLNRLKDRGESQTQTDTD